ncbi:MAG: ABC transporter ATP-binding protein, partial [Burkholderiaceae bacterium]
STLLNLVGLLDRPTQGRLQILGQETTALDDQALTRLRGRRIGFVFQYHHLMSAFSALENVMMPRVGLHGYPTAEIEAQAMRLIDSVGLSAWRDTPATRLSGGQQQRVAVARALIMQPALLLADEPTGNLDTQSADAVFDLFRQVNREHRTAVLLVTHNPALAKRCDRIIQVVDGRVQGD